MAEKKKKKQYNCDHCFDTGCACGGIGVSCHGCCDCPAGEWGKYCKHKMAIVLADERILFDEEQKDNFNKVKQWIVESGYPDLVQELRESEKALESAKKNVKNQKEKIARLMKEGLK